MSLAVAHHTKVPNFDLADPTCPLVLEWGQAGGWLLRPGDRMITSEHALGGLVLLTPLGFGRPMLGRRVAGGLRAEPGGVPCSPLRWRVATGVVALERDLERSVLEGQEWVVAVRLRPCAPGVDLRVAAAALVGGRMDRAGLEALSLRAAMAPERLGVEVALGAATDSAAAASLADETPFGAIRYQLEAPPAAPVQGLVRGPWAELRSADALPARPSRHEVQLALFGDSRS